MICHQQEGKPKALRIDSETRGSRQRQRESGKQNGRMWFSIDFIYYSNF